MSSTSEEPFYLPSELDGTTADNGHSRQFEIFDLINALERKCEETVEERMHEELERRTRLLQQSNEEWLRQQRAQLEDQERKIRAEYQVRLYELSSTVAENLEQLREWAKNQHTRRIHMLQTLVAQTQTQNEAVDALRQEADGERARLAAYRGLALLRADIEHSRPIAADSLQFDCPGVEDSLAVLRSYANRPVASRDRLVASLLTSPDFRVDACDEEQRAVLRQGDVCSFLRKQHTALPASVPTSWLLEAQASCEVFSAIHHIETGLERINYRQ